MVGAEEKEKPVEGNIENIEPSEKNIQMGCADNRKPSWFEAQTKKSDLADCLSMVLDC
jgi:hypothetical protein